MGKNAIQFSPDGNDLRKVFYYYGLEIEDKMLCPFHDDNNPSFHADFEDGMFICFACGVSGNAFDFVRLANQKLNGLQQLILYNAILKSDKVKKLKVKSLRKSKSKRQKAINDKKQLYDEAHDYYSGLKTIDWRKIDSEYKSYLIKRGFTSKALNDCKAKLTITDKNYPVIFPIFDNEEFKGYVCRTTNKRVEQQRKYLYNKGFSRRDTIAGTYSGETVVLCEGYMDMLKLKQFGLKNVGAILGWKITRHQVEKLKAKGVKNVISALDVDKPGENGTDYLHNFFKVTRFKFPKGVKDPGDLNKKQFDIAYRNTKKEFRRKA